MRSRQIRSYFAIGITGLLLLSGSVSSASAEPALRKNEPLSEFNKALLQSGWSPAITNRAFKDGTMVRSFGDAGIILDAGFTAIESCTGTGENFCIFNYKKGSRCLRVTTSGEYWRGHGEPSIWSWSPDCADDR